MKRLSLIAAPALLAGALLGLSNTAHAQGATNFFTLAVDPTNTSNISALQAGDVLKLDVIFNSDNTTQLFSYNSVIAFNPSVFNTAASTYTFGSTFTTNPQSSKLTNNAAAPYSQLFTATQANGGGTQTYPATNSVLGTYNLVVSNTATQGATNIFFSDTLPAGVPPQSSRKNLLFTTSTAFFTPTFTNNSVGVIVGSAAPVPETSTVVGLAALLVPAMWTLRRKRVTPVV